MKTGKVSLKTVIVLVILVLVGVLSFLGMETAKTYLSGASAGSEPKSVLATPAEDGKSVTITWSTDKAVQAVVEYGTTPASLLLRSLETDSTTSHKITINPLKPITSYYFRIRVGEEVYDNSGIPFSFKTKGTAVVAGPTGVLSPTGAVKIATTPTLTPSGTGNNACSRNTDYNGDGVVNSIDFVKCMNGPKSTGGVTPAVTQSSSECRFDKDYDANGIINSLDRIKCLQKK
jgi:hypothetical protein